MKQSFSEFLEAYRLQAGPVCNDLWDPIDTEYVLGLWKAVTQPVVDNTPEDE